MDVLIADNEIWAFVLTNVHSFQELQELPRLFQPRIQMQVSFAHVLAGSESAADHRTYINRREEPQAEGAHPDESRGIPGTS